MRKRSKYRPKHVLVNPVGFVLESMTPATNYSSIMLDLKIKNHGALTAATQGKATRDDIDTLIAMVNMTEAMYRLSFGTDYGDIISDANKALLELASRGVRLGDKFIMRADEMKALNAVVELHDAQLEVVTLRDLEKALDIVKSDITHKRAQRIL